MDICHCTHQQSFLCDFFELCVTFDPNLIIGEVEIEPTHEITQSTGKTHVCT